ncbi:nitrous oxide-stimulated promoter family protein [Phocaeicola plebeius]|uniref:nitrous oxide-stimulated promoter family protein n=1 Tax=Phocaeicola plebeius TaxID=310297 RepID=UPI0026F29D75|nr:nitrous oxide-stimulated promoter family protein [Phocaeicola plebeius]
MNKLSRIEEEKQTIEQMIHFYCRHKEKNQTLCSACSELLKYAHQRLEHCPFGERKKTCRQCTVHCYHPKMRQKIKEVMRFAGPRIIWYHPIWTLKHLWRERWPHLNCGFFLQ